VPKQRTPNKPREQYPLRTRLIHGSFATGRWDYDHRVVPPQSSSATYRLSSVHRGAQGFVELATPESRRAPIHIAEKSYTITLAVSLGQIKTLIESPFSMTHAVVPEEEKSRVGLRPGESGYPWGSRTVTTSLRIWRMRSEWSDHKYRCQVVAT
jgi:Cys/Met metabolism PLP-dependent enzyme